MYIQFILALNRYGTDEWGGPLVLQVHPETTNCKSLFCYAFMYVCMYIKFLLADRLTLHPRLLIAFRSVSMYRCMYVCVYSSC